MTLPASRFDGTTRLIHSTASNVGQERFTFVMVYLQAGSDVVRQTPFMFANSEVRVTRDINGDWEVSIREDGASNFRFIVRGLGTGQHVVDGIWHALMLSGEFATGLSSVWIDQSPGVITLAAQPTVNYGTKTTHTAGALGASEFYSGDVAYIYWNTEEYVPFDQGSIRNRIVTSSGVFGELGADGSELTGSAPAVYLAGDAASFPTNQGTLAGAWVESGSGLTAVPTNELPESRPIGGQEYAYLRRIRRG